MPADYRRSQRVQLRFQNSAAMLPNVTRYFVTDAYVGGIDAARAIASERMVINKIYARVAGPVGAGETHVYTLMVNGLATIITVTIGGAVQVDNSDLTNTITIEEGDFYNMRVAASLNAAAINLAVCCGGKY